MLNRIVHKLFSGNRDVYVLMFGTILSQAIPMIASVVLTRIYSAEDFGLFQAYFSISMIGTVFMTLRYEMAIMLPESKDDARHLTVLSCLISGVFSLLILVIVLLFRHRIAVWIGKPDLENSLFLLPFTLLVIGIYQALNYWSNRMKEYRRLSFSRVARAFNSSILSTGFGFLRGVQSIGLVLGDALGQASAAFFLYRRIVRDEPGLFRNIQFERLKQLGKRYRQFPLFNVPSGILEKMSGNLPSLLLIPFFGLGMVGLFGLSQRLISVPGSIVARAYGDVFRQSATEYYLRNGECRELFVSTFKRLAMLAFPGFIMLFFLVKPVFVLLFGEEWREAGVYAQILMPMFLAQFIVSPLSSMFLVAERQKSDFLLQICLFLAIFSALYGGYYAFGSARMTLVLYSGVYTVKYLIEFGLSYRFSRGNQDER